MSQIFDESSIGAIEEGAKRQMGDLETETTQGEVSLSQEVREEQKKNFSTNNSCTNNATTGKVSEGALRVVVYNPEDGGNSTALVFAGSLCGSLRKSPFFKAAKIERDAFARVRIF